MIIHRVKYWPALVCARLAVACGILVGFAASAAAEPPVLTGLGGGPTPVVGGPAFTLEVYGTGFVTGAVVQWSGQDLPTTFISGTYYLSAQVPASDIASLGTFIITVKNPDGGVSNGVNIAVIAMVDSISPASVPAGTGDFTLTIIGRGFPSNATVEWNGIPLTSTFVSSTQLTVLVAATRVLGPAMVMVTVWCPGVGIGSGATLMVTAPTLSAMSPATAVAGGPGFTLTVTGGEFVPGSLVEWNTQPLPTTFISSTQLTAQVPASAIAAAGGGQVYVQNDIYTDSNALRFTVTQTAAPPSLSSLSPNSATAGGPAFTLTVNGSGFLAGSTVQWSGSALATSYFGGNQLTASVPASLIANAGSASIAVLNPGGVVSNASAFTISAPTLSLSSLSPNSIAAGGPFLMLTVNGSGFLAGATVQWNGSALATSYFGTNQLLATVPASLVASAGTASVTVLNPGGATSNALAFTITTPTPSLSNLLPNSVTAGGPAFTLTVNGGNFLVGATVQWNGSALPTSNLGGYRLTAPVAASLIANAGSVSITVLNPGGIVSNAVPFTINPPTPFPSSLSPNSVTAGGPAFTLTVSGSGFLAGSTVQWNAIALATSYFGGNQLTASVAASLITNAGSASITVLNPAGIVSNPLAFTINAPTPFLSSLTPNSATAGGPAFPLTLNGSGFLIGSTVQWNGSALATSYLSGNQLTASVAASLMTNIGSVSITVLNPGGIVSNALAFNLNAPTPSLSSLSPNSVTAGGPAFALTVNGSGFLTGSTVQWNGLALPSSYVGGTRLTASVSASLITNAGSAGITILNPGGIVSNALALTINAPTPSLSSLSPSSATAAGAAFTLTVNGSGFLTGSTVQWNGLALATIYPGGNRLTASVAASLIANAGNASVVVVNPTGIISNALTFTITASGASGPSIPTLSPLPAGTVGVPYSQALSATGGVTPYKSWTVVDIVDLPPGISLETPGGVPALLTGAPTAAGTFTFTVQVTDSANASATKQFSLTIDSGAVSISANGIANAASYMGGSVSPGEIVTIFGSGFGPNTLVGLELDSRGRVSTSLAETQVLFDGVAAPMIYAQAGQVSAVVPYEVNAESTTQVQVVYQGQGSNVVSMPVSAVMPGIFTMDASGHGPGAVVNQDGTVNSTSHPASAGTYVTVYATGEGQTNPLGVDGKPGDWPAPLPVAQPVTAAIGGILVQVLQYAGGAPGMVAGVLQLNILIPQGVPTGAMVPIVISVGGQNSQANVVLAIK